MKKIAIGIAVAVALIGSALLVTPALAADMATKMPVKAPPLPTPAYNWSGFYLGGYYGASWSQSTASNPNLAVGDSASGALDINSTSVTAGVTAGYNLQLSPNWLVGVEGDYGYFGGGQLFQQFDNDVQSFGEKNRWYGTLRGRVGFLTGPSLIYLTGGVGFVHLTDSFGGDAIAKLPPTSRATTTTGGVIGAGIETKLSRNWSVKTEYLYIDGGGDHTFLSSTAGTPENTPTNFSHSFQVIKTGLNYRFDGNWDGLPFFNGTLLASNHNWNGFYIGGNAGIGSSLTNVHSLTPQAQGDNYLNGTGFTGGGQAGYNYMLWQKYLIGVEGDFGALSINHDLADLGNTTPPGAVVFSEKTSWYGTLRGRIGTTTGPALLYLTGGFAWVHLRDGVLPSPSISVPPFNLVPGSVATKTGTGFTWGGGTEVALDQHWSAKLESLYVNSGSSTHLVFPPITSPVTTITEFKERFVIVRFGLNYAFN